MVAFWAKAGLKNGQWVGFPNFPQLIWQSSIEFGRIQLKVNASPFPRPDEPKTDQLPYIVLGKTSIRFGIPGHIS